MPAWVRQPLLNAQAFCVLPKPKNPLDNTSVHPESYTLAEQILAELGFDLKHCNDIAVQEAAAKADASAIAVKLNAGLPTVTDILEALARPGTRSAQKTLRHR